MVATPDGQKRHQYDLHLGKARILLQLGGSAAAGQEAVKASRIDDSRWEAYAVGATVLLRQKQFSQAKVLLQLAIDRAPHEENKLKLALAVKECDMELLYFSYAQAGSQANAKRDYAAASHHFAQAAQVFPTRGEYKVAAAMAAVMNGEYERASIDFLQLRSDGDATVAQKARRMIALLTAQKLIAPMTSAADRQHNIALSLAKQHKWHEAEAAYREAVRLEPSDPWWYVNLALMLSKQQRWPEATDAYLKAVSLDVSDPRTFSNLGATLLQQKRWREAEAAYREATRIEPITAAYHDGLATALFYNNRLPEAVLSFQDAVRLEPANATYQEHLNQARILLRKP